MEKYFFCFWLFYHFFLPAQETLFVEQSLKQEIDPSCFILTLSEGITQALNNNKQFMNSLDNVVKSRYGVNLASNAFDIQFSPNGKAGYVGGGRVGTGMSVGGGLDATKKFPTGTQITLSPSVLKTKEHYRTDIRATVMQPLLRGLGKSYQLSQLFASQFALRTAYRNLYLAQVQLILRTIQSLYEVLKAEKSVELNRESYRRVQQFYQSALLKAKIGLTDSLDVYRAEIEMRQAKDTLTSAEERLQDSKDSVRELLALPLDSSIQVDLPLASNTNSLEVNEAIEIALQQRIEIDQALDQAKENKRLSTIAKKNLYPELNLILNYANCGRDEFFTRSCTRRRESTWGIGFSTSTDFNPFAEQVAYEQALLNVEASLRGIEQTQTQIVLDVKKNMRQLARAIQRIQLQEEQMKTAQNELQLSTIKFNRGILTDNLTLIQAEKSLRNAEQMYWAALVELEVGKYQVLASLGLLIDKPLFSL